MLTDKISDIKEDNYIPRRSISSKIEKEIKEKTINLRGRHRKTESSLFLDNYFSAKELQKYKQENKKINDDNIINNKINNDINDDYSSTLLKQNNLNTLKNSLLNEKTSYTSRLKENMNNIGKIITLDNASFYSYSIEDENNYKNNENEEEISPIMKVGDESLTNNCETKSNSYINNTNNFNNNPFYELEKNSEKFSKEKSFIPIKNTLKYIKDKEERVTDSYLMALNEGEKNKKDGKSQYLPTASIIEEEKSEFIESTSKKPSIINGGKILKDINFTKKNIENDFNLVNNNNLNKFNNENKENINIKGNNTYKNKEISKKNKLKKSHKITFDLNNIIIKNSNKERIKRKYIKKNKENLLNSFYNISNAKNISVSSSNKICIRKKYINGSFCNINTSPYNNNKNIINNNIYNSINYIKLESKEKNKKLTKSFIKYILKFPNIIINKKKRAYSYSGVYIRKLYHQRFNTDNFILKNENKNKYNLSKFDIKKKDKNSCIYHIYESSNNSNHSKKKLNKSMNNPSSLKSKINQKMKIPHNKFEKFTLKNRNNENSNKNLYNNLNINKTIKKRENKVFIDLSQRRSISISSDKNQEKINHKKILSDGLGDYNSLNNLNYDMKLLYYDVKTNLGRDNSSKILNPLQKRKIFRKDKTHYDSCICLTKKKYKRRIFDNRNYYKNIDIKNTIKKVNRSIYNSKCEYENDYNDINEINISNKNQTLIILKEKIKFLKNYEKNDVIEKMKNISSNKSNFIILCDNKNDNDKSFVFRGLFKYYENHKKFIKIYGNEKCINSISLKNINSSDFEIFENKIIQNEENNIHFLFDLIDYFYFSFNSIIICKK